MSIHPLYDFKETLCAFADGKRRGIRNPFVIVPVEPELEYGVAQRLIQWSENEEREITYICLDQLMPKTDVFQVVCSLPECFRDKDSRQQAKREQRTLRGSLVSEVTDLILHEHSVKQKSANDIVLLLHLGSLYPFARASELLDEMDRRNVRSTLGVLFPGHISAGKLNFFGTGARHYYPAHCIDTTVSNKHLS